MAGKAARRTGKADEARMKGCSSAFWTILRGSALRAFAPQDEVLAVLTLYLPHPYMRRRESSAFLTSRAGLFPVRSSRGSVLWFDRRRRPFPRPDLSSTGQA